MYKQRQYISLNLFNGIFLGLKASITDTDITDVSIKLLFSALIFNHWL